MMTGRGSTISHSRGRRRGEVSGNSSSGSLCSHCSTFTAPMPILQLQLIVLFAITATHCTTRASRHHHSGHAVDTTAHDTAFNDERGDFCDETVARGAIGSKAPFNTYYDIPGRSVVPPLTLYHAMVTLPATEGHISHETLVLFGGYLVSSAPIVDGDATVEAGTGTTGYTYELVAHRYMWSWRRSSCNTPPTRGMHTMVAIDIKGVPHALMFGGALAHAAGSGGRDALGALGDMWAYNPSDNCVPDGHFVPASKCILQCRSWVRMEAKGDGPGAVAGHQATMIDSNIMVVVGGCRNIVSYFIDNLAIPELTYVCEDPPDTRLPVHTFTLARDGSYSGTWARIDALNPDSGGGGGGGGIVPTLAPTNRFLTTGCPYQYLKSERRKERYDVAIYGGWKFANLSDPIKGYSTGFFEELWLLSLSRANNNNSTGSTNTTNTSTTTTTPPVITDYNGDGGGISDKGNNSSHLRLQAHWQDLSHLLDDLPEGSAVGRGAAYCECGVMSLVLLLKGFTGVMGTRAQILGVDLDNERLIMPRNGTGFSGVPFPGRGRFINQVRVRSTPSLSMLGGTLVVYGNYVNGETGAPSPMWRLLRRYEDENGKSVSMPAQTIHKGTAGPSSGLPGVVACPLTGSMATNAPDIPWTARLLSTTWVDQNVDITPAPRFGHTYTTLSDGCQYIFGGFNSEPLSGVWRLCEPLSANPTWDLLINRDRAWKTLANGFIPQGRWAHTATALPDRKTMIVIGGTVSEAQDEMASVGCLRDVWKFHLDDGSAYWEEVQVQNPLCVQSHSAILVDSDHIIVAGGLHHVDDNIDVANSFATFIFTISTGRFKYLPITGSDPGTRFLSSAWITSNKLTVVGGSQGIVRDSNAIAQGTSLQWFASLDGLFESDFKLHFRPSDDETTLEARAYCHFRTRSLYSLVVYPCWITRS
eukprot:UC1_evm3s479